MYETEPILKNDMYRIIWDFEIQADHLIQTRKSDHWQEKKEVLPSSGLCRSGGPQSENKGKI